jgi:glyoxylase-like metal-dependent hydrolase (beta-lactamase superfamily II)
MLHGNGNLLNVSTSSGRALFLALLVYVFCAPVSAVSDDKTPVSERDTPYTGDLLKRVRTAAVAVPGEMATNINFAKVAESHRSYAAIIEGGNEETFISARTAFQILFPRGSIMLDSGMDEEVHRYYGFGREEPYWQEANNDVQTALVAARLIIVTHEHGDHVAGVIRSAHHEQLAAKTILTKSQVNTLVTAPQIPQIGLSAEQAANYIVVDYELILPVAPGIVLVKAPGHTPGHQMVYVQLASGKEFLFIGDIGWSLDNISKLRLRPAATSARIGEDPQALMQQMLWIKQVMERDGLTIVPSHDDRLLSRYVEDGLLGKFP